AGRGGGALGQRRPAGGQRRPGGGGQQKFAAIDHGGALPSLRRDSGTQTAPARKRRPHYKAVMSARPQAATSRSSTASGTEPLRRTASWKSRRSKSARASAWRRRRAITVWPTMIG